MFKVIGGCIAAIIGIMAFVWAIQGNDFFMYRFFAPKYEAVRRDVFENTPSYKWGMIQELQNMQFKYEQSTPEQKEALSAIILRRANQYGEERLPADLYAFIQNLKKQRNQGRF